MNIDLLISQMRLEVERAKLEHDRQNRLMQLQQNSNPYYDSYVSLHNNWNTIMSSGISLRNQPFSDEEMKEEFQKREAIHEHNRKVAEEAKKKAEEKRQEEKRNMQLWGRKDDPRLDPTSDMYDPLKLVYKDEGSD